MKKTILALLAAGTVLALAGCCCDKADKNCHNSERKMCHKKHHHSKACAQKECPKPVPAPPSQQTQQPQTAATETVVVEAVGD